MNEVVQTAAGTPPVHLGVRVGTKPTLGIMSVAKRNQYPGNIRQVVG